MEEGELAVGVFVDLDRCLDEVAAVGLFGDLQGEALVAHGVVVLDLALFLDGEDVGKRAADIGEESRALFGGGNREAVIEGRQEGLGDEAVGRLDAGDAGQAQLLGQTPLQGAEEPLDAPSGPRRPGGE